MALLPSKQGLQYPIELFPIGFNSLIKIIGKMKAWSSSHWLTKIKKKKISNYSMWITDNTKVTRLLQPLTIKLPSLAPYIYTYIHRIFIIFYISWMQSLITKTSSSNYIDLMIQTTLIKAGYERPCS